MVDFQAALRGIFLVPDDPLSEFVCKVFRHANIFEGLCGQVDRRTQEPRRQVRPDRVGQDLTSRLAGRGRPAKQFNRSQYSEDDDYKQYLEIRCHICFPQVFH
jgi:hypothetical protein